MNTITGIQTVAKTFKLASCDVVRVLKSRSLDVVYFNVYVSLKFVREVKMASNSLKVSYFLMYSL